MAQQCSTRGFITRQKVGMYPGMCQDFGHGTTMAFAMLTDVERGKAQAKYIDLAHQVMERAIGNGGTRISDEGIVHDLQVVA